MFAIGFILPHPKSLVIFFLTLLSNITFVAAATPIPTDQLTAIIKSELADAYRPGNDANYLSAHQSLEQFFSTPDSKNRTTILTTLQQTGIDPNALGRLTRLHSDWPSLAPETVTEIQDHLGPIKVHYFLGTPQKYDRITPWPLVIKLADPQSFAANPKPSADDIRRIYTDWINQELSHHPTALVLMPVRDPEASWGPSYQSMNTVMGALQHAASQANIDPSRIYLIGHAAAANAAWNLAALYPTYFTAINPLATGPLADWQKLRLTNLHNLLVVPWNDTDDKLIPPEAAQNLAATLQRLKVDVDFTETHGIGDDPTQPILDQCYEKLLSRKRDLYPKQIDLISNRPDTQFNRIDWLQIYQPKLPGDEKHLYFDRVPGRMTLMPNPWSAHAFIAANRIEITTENVALLRIYLNDQLVDLHEPVTVSVNNQTRFEGIVPQSIKQLLNDQLFLGRGWRYYTGVIDIDLTTKPATTTTISH